jgi:serine protease inhibitor
VTLKMANRIYVSKKFNVKPNYKYLIRQTFFSDVCELDVNAPEKSAEMINNWVEMNTDQKIHDIVTDGSSI